MTNRVGAAPAPQPNWAQRILQNAPSVSTMLQRAGEATQLPGQLREVRDSFAGRPRSLREVGTQTRQNFRNAARDARQGPTDLFDRRQVAGRAIRGVNALTTAASLPGAARQTAREVRQAIRSGSREDIERAVGSTTNLVRDTVGTAGQTAGVVRDVTRYRRSYTAARQRFTQRAPGAPAAARRVARRVAADSLRLRVDGNRVGSGPTRQAMQQRAAAAARRAPQRVAQRVATAATNSAVRAGRQAAVRSAATLAGRTAARFVPLANAAIAVADANAAYQAWRDPNASAGRRATATVTAAASALAATNIPVVSQAAAVVATLSSWVGSWFS